MPGHFVDNSISLGRIEFDAEHSITIPIPGFRLLMKSGSRRRRLMPDNVPTIEIRGNVTCILLGEAFDTLDDHCLDAIRKTMLDAISSIDPPRVVVDLSHTSFFGSSFIEVLFRVWNRIIGKPGGRFTISGLTPYCREVLEVTHLDRLWELHESLDSAVASLKD